MATATLTNVPTTLDLAESTASWNGDTFELEPDIKIQGSNSVACTLTTNGNNDVYVDGFTAADLSTEHIRLWFNISFVGNLATTDPIQVFISDGTNTAYWNAGQDSYAGGWAQAVIYTGNTPLSGTKPTGNSTRVGIRFVTSSKPRNVPQNAWFDAWYYGDGYTVTGGTNGDEISWTEIAAADEANSYGIVRNINDVYFLAGAVQVGDGTATTYFKDSGQIAVFRDLSVSSTLYDITFFDDASNVTNVDITGGTYSAAGSQNYTIDASITDINSFSMTGKQIAQAGTIDFAAGQTITNCVFDNCGQVSPSTATFQNNTLSNYVGTDGALLWGDSSNTKDLVFINCDNGVEFTTTSSPKSFDNLTFDDEPGNFDVNNTSGSAITVNLTNSANANSYNTGNSAVTFASSVLLSLTVIDEAGLPVSGANAFIDDNNNVPYIMNTTTNASGVASTTWTGGAVVGATWRVRKYGYKAYKATSDISTVNKDIPVTLVADPQQV